MSNLMVKDLQKQDPGSGLVELFELELSSSNTIYFHPGVEEDLSTVQFREEGGTVRTYTTLPMQATGFNIDPQGTSARPTLVFANVENIFKNAVGDFDTLLGKRITRRTTLKKYLVGESGDSTPPVEFPKQVYLFDRIANQDKTVITFECSTPFDLQGITLPKRQVIANACPWVYQGADADLNEHQKVGACTWSRESKFKAMSGTTVKEYIPLVNIDDEYIVPSTGETGAITFSTSVSSITVDGYYTTNTTLATTGVQRLKKDGGKDTSANGNTVPNYWQAVRTVANAGTINDDNPHIKRVRIWDTWSGSTTYYSYTDDRYNDYVRYTSGGLTRLWKAKKTSLNQAPDFGDFWELADACSKTTTGCKMRYGFNPITSGSNSSTGKTLTNTSVQLPFGGFPGARRFS